VRVCVHVVLVLDIDSAATEARAPQTRTATQSSLLVLPFPSKPGGLRLPPFSRLI
jgi:hypothetical protein